MRCGIPIAAGLLMAVAAWFFELPLRFGAHPFWADQVIFWGTPIGIALALVSLRLQYAIRTGCILILAGIAFGVAHTGKTRFAASYAEDAFAGQMWFFGWHAVIIFAIAGITSGLRFNR